MNEIDDLKLLRLQEEKKFLDNEFIEELARELIGGLVQWTNDEILNALGGQLTFAITLGAPNAGVAIHPSRPMHPRMEFRLSLIEDMYVDAFSFPLICRRIGKETEALTNLNATEQFSNCRVKFESHLPHLDQSDVVELFRPVCKKFIDLQLENSGDEAKLQIDEIRCRFIMFELMIVWTFFHELGHIVQGHHRLHKNHSSLIDTCDFLEFAEFSSTQPDKLETTSAAGGSAEPDLAAQARELMADATDQTLKYLAVRGRLKFGVWYLLLCSTGCMFQRFYAGYPDNLEISQARHPHPLIRDEMSQLLNSNWLVEYLLSSNSIQNREEAQIPLAYLSVRASLMTGMFRSHRIEKKEEEISLPSYMRLLKNNLDDQLSYIKKLIPEIERQLPAVLEYHLIEMHSLEYWLNLMKAMAIQDR